ncbi:MAG: hypothetical protein MZW92_68585 [Comamonadaceae bacterium]|nr:hypothetical protein [Comamonadaceae bacterium]
MMGVDIGPKTVAGYAARHRHGQDHLLERARWASSRSKPSARGPSASPRPWPASGADLDRRRRGFASRPSKKAGVGDKMQPHLDGRRRLARVHRRTRRCPASRRWRTRWPDGARGPFVAGNWKMNLTVAEAGALARGASRRSGRRRRARGRRSSRPSPPWRRRGGDRPGSAVRLGRPGPPLGGAGRLHRRGLGAHAAEDAGCRLRPRRPLRAAPVLRRDRRDGQPQDPGRPARPGSAPSSASARSSSRARGRRDARAGSDDQLARRPGRPPAHEIGPPSPSPTSRSGPSGRAGPPPRPRRRRSTPISGAGSEESYGNETRRLCYNPLRRLRQAGQFLSVVQGKGHRRILGRRSVPRRRSRFVGIVGEALRAYREEK